MLQISKLPLALREELKVLIKNEGSQVAIANKILSSCGLNPCLVSCTFEKVSSPVLDFKYLFGFNLHEYSVKDYKVAFCFIVALFSSFSVLPIFCNDYSLSNSTFILCN